MQKIIIEKQIYFNTERTQNSIVLIVVGSLLWDELIYFVPDHGCHHLNANVELLFATFFLPAANGQRPRNYLSSCSYCSCSPFGSIPHLNNFVYWLAWDLNLRPPDHESTALSTELL